MARFLNNKPLSFFASVFALRDLAFGFGLLLALSDLSHSVLVANLNELGGAQIYGAFLVIVSCVTATAGVLKNLPITRFGLTVQAWFWLFACMSYLFNGNWLLAVIFMLMCSIPSGYLAYFYRYTPYHEGVDTAA